MRPDPVLEHRLPIFIDSLMRAPLVWGERDCMLVAADWLVELGYPDPAAAYRRTYASAEAADAVLSRDGGLVAVMHRGAVGLGLRSARVKDALTGDLGAVRVKTGLGGQVVERPCAAIRLDDGWALFTGRGWLVERAAALAAWRVIPCPRR